MLNMLVEEQCQGRKNDQGKFLFWPEVSNLLLNKVQKILKISYFQIFIWLRKQSL